MTCTVTNISKIKIVTVKREIRPNKKFAEIMTGIKR